MSNGMLMANDDLLLVIDELCPGLEPGRDFMVSHYLDENRVQQGHATIYQWTNVLHAQPTQYQLEMHWNANATKVLTRGVEKALRYQRELLLETADNLVNHAHDSGNEAYFSAAKAYRQALRDVPQQSGWPDDIVWPVVPTQPK